MTNKKNIITAFVLTLIISVAGIFLFLAQGQVEASEQNAELQKNAARDVSGLFAKLTYFDPGQKKFPDFEILNTEGQAIALSSLYPENGYLLLNLWATWCPPCINELPYVEELGKIAVSKNMPLHVYALSLDQKLTQEELKNFLERYALSDFALYQDYTNALIKKYSVPAMPTTLLIDKDGFVRVEFLGDAEWSAPEIVGFLETFTQ